MRWRAVVHPDENVMIIPFSYDGQAMLWQQQAGYGFRMTGGYVSATFPDALWQSPIVRAIYGAPLPPFPERELRAFARDRQVDVVLLRSGWPGPWERVLRAAYGPAARRRRHVRLAGTRHLAALARVSRMTHRIAVLAGDGVGPEVVSEARLCVDELGLEIEWSDLDWGSDHWLEHGVMMPPDAVEQLRAFDAILLGAVGRPDIPDHVTLWGLLLPIRQRLDLWANVRPVRLLEGVPCALAGRGPGDIDMVFVRENSEGEYSGVGGRAHQGHPGEVGIETAVFTRAGIERVVEHAFSSPPSAAAW